NFLFLLSCALLAALSPAAYATVFATVRGVVHDPQHRPVAGAHITLKSQDSAFSLQATTGSDGAFSLPEVPIGSYTLEIKAEGFARASQQITLASGTNP